MQFVILLAVLLISFNMSTATSSSSCDTALDPIVHKFPGSDELSEAIVKQIIALSQKAIEDRGEFSIAFSGGSLPALVAKPLVAQQAKVDFAKWKVYLADERHVAHDHADSNLKLVRDLLLSKLDNAPTQVFGVAHELPVEQAALEYETHLPIGKMDLILLGMGPDGHTASLFPEHELLEYNGKQRVVSIKDSPKPPAERITLTLEYINTQAANVYFVTTGSSKQDVVARCAVPQDKLEANPLPSGRVRPRGVAVQWFVDNDAGAKL